MDIRLYNAQYHQLDDGQVRLKLPQFGISVIEKDLPTAIQRLQNQASALSLRPESEAPITNDPHIVHMTIAFSPKMITRTVRLPAKLYQKAQELGINFTYVARNALEQKVAEEIKLMKEEEK